MRKELIEEIKRIHEITYNGKDIVGEGYIDNLLNKAKQKLGGIKQDVSSKADYVNPDVQDLFNTLQKASQSGGLLQGKRGSSMYQKEVEALQIALVLLGFDLPRYGVDGYFGPETASALNSFKKSTLNENVETLRDTLDTLGYDEKGNELTSGGEVGNEITDMLTKILKDFKTYRPDVKVIITSGNDMYHKNLNYSSAHTRGQSIDVTLNPYNQDTDKAFKTILDGYKSKYPKFRYIDEYTSPSKGSTGGHFHLEYLGGSNVEQQQGQQANSVVASPETLNRIIELLKVQDITPEDIKQYTDPVAKTGGEIDTKLDLRTEEGFNRYASICDTFLNLYPNPLRITGDMLASGARKAFTEYGKIVPPELALAQLLLEGGINSKPESKPVRTRNPFNVGNVDMGASKTFNDVQTGIDVYFRLIASRFIDNNKTAKDLLSNFVNKQGNRYASDVNYENKLSAIAQRVNKISQGITT